jgi:hypothetical protein
MSIILNGTTGITTPGIINTGTFTFQGVVELPAGSNSAPSLTTTGDTNTGIYFPAADQVAITTGGTQRLIVDASGNLGLGVTPPTSAASGVLFFKSGGQYSFAGPVAYQDVNVVFDNAADRYIANGHATRFSSLNGVQSWSVAPSGTADDPITFTQAMTLTAAGNLGVGTTSPTTFSITGKHFEVDGGTDNYAFIHARTPNVRGFFAINDIDDVAALFAYTNHPLIFGTNNTERMRITAAGNVGIGTTTANGKLQFVADIGARKIVLYEGANNDYQFYGFGILPATLLYNTFSLGDDHVFAVGTSSTTRKELMRISSTHNSVQIPGQPGFKQAWDTRNSTGTVRILGTNQGDTVETGRDEFNQGSHFNTATGRFTCPVAGMYVFGISTMRNLNDGSIIDIRILKNGNATWARSYAGAYTSDYQQSMLVTITDAAANDYIEFQIGPNTSLYEDDTYCFGYLIG